MQVTFTSFLNNYYSEKKLNVKMHNPQINKKDSERRPDIVVVYDRVIRKNCNSGISTGRGQCDASTSG